MHAEDIFPYKGDIVPRIAIIDAGIQLDNTYLKNANITQIVLDYSQRSNQIHGTMVAGILVSQGEAGEPQGLVNAGNILSIQAGTDQGMTSKQLIESINIAIEKNVDVINISMGTTKDSPELREVVENALKKGVVIIASAGNIGEYQEYYPAAYNEVISVGAVDSQKKIFNNTNISTVDLFAPGDKLITTASTKEGKYYFSGNSAATPVVTAAVALIIHKNPNLKVNAIKNILLSTADTVNYKNKYIKVLNLKRALEEATIHSEQ